MTTQFVLFGYHHLATIFTIGTISILFPIFIRFINNKIVTKGENIIEETVGSISTKYWEPGFKDKLKIFKNIFKEVNSYRCIGFEYIDIGIGIRNFAILSKLSPWDHIPGILFVREAGGADIDFAKNKYDFTKKNKNLIVSNSEDLNFKILEKIGEY